VSVTLDEAGMLGTGSRLLTAAELAAMGGRLVREPVAVGDVVEVVFDERGGAR
jgi:hypothetical protein